MLKPVSNDPNSAPLTAVERYCAIDVSTEGALHRMLLDQAAAEASRAVITLTAAGDKGAMSQGLTPMMNQWLQTHIAPARYAALAQLDGEVRAIRIATNVDGMLLELREDKIRRERAERQIETVSAFNTKHQNALEDIVRLQAEYDGMRMDEGGRDAKTPNKWLEFGILIPAILAPEALLNFESFRRAPIIQSDVMALGATILVGLGIAAAAYCIGLYVRQLHYFTRPDDGGRAIAGWPLYTFGSLALSLSLGSVAVARFYYLMPLIQDAIVLGNRPPNVVFSIGGLLLGNLICYLLGAILTFFLNDPNPEFADRAVALRKARRAISRDMKREVQAKLDIADARAKRDIDEARRRAAQMSGKPGYSELLERLETVKAKDAEVVGALHSYRAALVGVRGSQDGVFELRNLAADRADAPIRLSSDAFLSEPLELSKCA